MTTTTATTRGRVPAAYKGVLTTGDVARACGVAMRTAAGWCDTGLLPAYRIPNAAGGESRDRRVKLPDLIAFCREHGLPCRLDTAATLLSAAADLAPAAELLDPCHPCPTVLSLGHRLGGLEPAAVVALDFSHLGRADAMSVAAGCRAWAAPSARLLAVCCEDEPDPVGLRKLFDAVLSRPTCTPEVLACAVRKLLAGRGVSP